MVQEWVYDASSAAAAPLRLHEAPSTSAAVGDWVFAYGPWRTEFVARPADLVKIDTQLDDPLSYLSLLRDEVVRLYAAVQTVQKSNQDAACVLGADTANGRIATALLKTLGFQVLAVPQFADAAAIVQADSQADHVHPLADTELATIVRTVGVDKLKVCVDCSQGVSETARLCNLAAQDGLVVSWATAAVTPDAQLALSSLVEAQITVKAIRPSRPTPALHQARCVVRDMFRKHSVPNVVRVEHGFENLASVCSAQAASELVVVQVEPELPQPANDVLPEAVELQRFIAEADIALRSVITDTALQKVVSQHQATLRTKLRRLEEDQQQHRQEVAAKPDRAKEGQDEEATRAPAVAEEKTDERARVAPPPGAKFISIDTFAWDQGGYNSPTVTVYVNLPGVGTVKDSVHCHFDRNSFDLTVYGLNGKNYRLLKDNLEKDIVPAESKFTVKQNKVVVKLTKKKGEFSYEHWTNLTAKRKRDATAATKDPMGGIMDLMRDMYEEGDDQTRKLIGEAMMKAQRGDKQSPPSLDDL